MKPYKFGFGQADGDAGQKDLLGGKGAGLAEMTKLGLPVPAGITIPTDQSVLYNQQVPLDQQNMARDWAKVAAAEIESLASRYGYIPLVSVRSGARVSMPGMMDTLLNVGLTEDNYFEWKNRLGRRAYYDSLRRFYQMIGAVAYGVPAHKFNGAFDQIKKDGGAPTDADMTWQNLKAVVMAYRKILGAANIVVPETLEGQLEVAITSVWKSWDNERARTYRKMHGYSDNWGTAVTVQSMVFGNANEKSGTGVLFTRDQNTGEPGLVGEWLPNAQGEDVVAGVRTPLGLSELSEWNPKVAARLTKLALKLEKHYRDMQDIEFTVQDGNLFILQTRAGKRSAEAAFRIAGDLAAEKLIKKDQVHTRVTGKQFSQLKVLRVPKSFKGKPSLKGIPAAGWAVSGVAVFTVDQAVQSKVPCILVRHETCPDDLKGMVASAGILTATGGGTSHAAVVAVGLGKTCVVGCTSLKVNQNTATVVSADGSTATFGPGTKIVLDGSTGRVWVGQEVPLVGGSYGDGPEELVLALAKKHGYMPEVEYRLDATGSVTDIYVPRATKVVVRTAAFDNLTGEQRRHNVWVLCNSALAAGARVYVDLARPVYSFDDQSLNDLAQMDETAIQGAKLEAIKNLKGQQIKLLNGEKAASLPAIAFALLGAP